MQCTRGYTFFYGHKPTKSAKQKLWVFSQWWPCSFRDPASGASYTSTEQWMMAKKAELFDDKATLAEIMATNDPRKIKALGRKVANFQPGTWASASYDIVVQGNLLKFSQDEGLRTELLGTGDTLLVEASPTDSIWGIGLSAAAARNTPEAEWPGRNLLGKALTQVREQLRAQEQDGGAELGEATTKADASVGRACGDGDEVQAPAPAPAVDAPLDAQGQPARKLSGDGSAGGPDKKKARQD